MKPVFLFLLAATPGLVYSSRDSLHLFEHVSRLDLSKAKWLKGCWQGEFKDQPFYEAYQFPNDSTICIVSFHWDGKDTSGSSEAYLQWENGSYYLGDSLNWKVTSIDSFSIRMIPHHKSQNKILWTYVDSDTWVAVLSDPRKTVAYVMKRNPELELRFGMRKP